jgi:folate-binding protein YgfZ
VLRLEGSDTLDLLHRLSASKLADLARGACRAALFCDFRGRLLHRAVAAATRDGAVWLLRHDAAGEELAAFVERAVFRENVRIANLGASWRACAAPGGTTSVTSGGATHARGDAHAQRGSAARGNAHPGEPAAAAGGTFAVGPIEERDGVPLRARIATDWALALVPAGTPCAGQDEYQRIRAGQPRHGHEIHPDFTPFEVGLAHEVHLAKGCYPGQEALARLVTYRSVRRRLVRLAGDAPAPKPPCEVRVNGEVAGKLTSVAEDGASRWLALAVLRHEAASPGARLEIAGAGAVRAIEPFEVREPLGLA